MVWQDLKIWVKHKNLKYRLNDYDEYKLNIESKMSNLIDESKSLQKELNRSKIDAEMTANHLETKIRLLKEALNKRNDDVKELEKSNENLLEVLSKCEEKLIKLDEDFRLEQIKWEQYEKQLFQKNEKFEKIDIETIDGRISFMVNVLEEYRKILEEDSQFESESKLLKSHKLYRWE